GLEGSPGQPNYSAAKEGIVVLTRSTALAMAKYGVRCNAISPTADTRMTQRLPGERRGAATATPPEAIAPGAKVLASTRAGHPTRPGTGGVGALGTRLRPGDRGPRRRVHRDVAPRAAAHRERRGRVDRGGAGRDVGSR